ncbi:MAG: GntR family transcriptional regulator [Rhizobiales bacterium]|nr:GntR family transcriptional regulator [Hyphomicrobiales bacterium]
MPNPISLSDMPAMYLNIYEALREGIIAGGVRPGQTLSNRAIAAHLGVSTTPVRDALRRLAADGVLQTLPKSAFRVPVISAERYAQILELRVLLERFAADRAAQAIDRATLKRLTEINARYANASLSQDERLLANREFHFTIYRASLMDDLVSLIELLWVRIGPLLNFTTSSADQSVGLQHHKDLIAALRQKDGPAAARAVEADLRYAAKSIMTGLQREKDVASRQAS